MVVVFIFCIFVIVVLTTLKCIYPLIPIMETNHLYAILFACAGILLLIAAFKVYKYIKDTIDIKIEINEFKLKELKRREKEENELNNLES